MGSNSIADAIFHPDLQNSIPSPTIAISSGDNQTVVANNALSSALVVIVKDGYGKLLSGQQVDWSTSGGTLGSASTNTAATGLATNTLTASTTAGFYTVTATIHGTSISTTFSVTVSRYVTSGLLVDFDAALANNGTGPYTPGCAAGQLTWKEPVNGLTGTLNNFAGCGVTKGWNGTGISTDPYRITFSGNNWVDLGTPGIFPTGFSARTLCAWAEIDVITGGFQEAVGYGSAAPGNGMFFGTLNQRLFGGGYASNIVSAGNFWVVGQWNNICLTYDGTTGLLYGNDTLMASGVLAWNLVMTASSIGQDMNGGDFWTGSVADVKLYNRVLSPAEITQNCKAQVTRFLGASCN